MKCIKMEYEMNFFLTLFLLLLFDLTWISLYMGNLFKPMIENIQGSPLNVNIYRGVTAYIVLFLFAYLFIPKMDNYTDTFFLGFFAYGIYETTSLALFDKWDPSIVLFDCIWGGILLCLLRYFCLTEK